MPNKSIMQLSVVFGFSSIFDLFTTAKEAFFVTRVGSFWSCEEFRVLQRDKPPNKNIPGDPS
jgi:hypothetical protein